MKKLPTILSLIVILVLVIIIGTVFYVNQSDKKDNTNQPTKSYVSSMLAEPLTLEERISKADVIIQGKVKEQLSSQRIKKEKSEYIYTDYVVQVDKYLKNPLSYNRLKVRLQGGDVSDEHMFVEDEPTLTLNDNVVLLLTRATFITEDAPADVYSIFWGEDGKFTIDGNEAKGGYRNDVYNVDEFMGKISSLSK